MLKLKSITAAVISAVLMAPIMPVASMAATPDATPPVVSISAPTNGSTVSGTVNVKANAYDLYSSCVITVFGHLYDVTPLQPSGAHPGGNVFVCGTDQTALYQSIHGTDTSRIAPYLLPSTYVGVTKVEFYLDGSLVSTVPTSATSYNLSASTTPVPFSFNWNTTGVANGSHVLMAKAYDGTNTTNSSNVTITVNNTTTTPPPTSDTSTPTALITSPTNGSTVSGTATITVSASDNVGVTKVEIYIDGALSATDSSSPFSFAWNTVGAINGSHSLMAKAYDAAGNVGSSSVVNVTVNNSSTTTPGGNHGDDRDNDDQNEHEIGEGHHGSHGKHESHGHKNRRSEELSSARNERD